MSILHIAALLATFSIASCSFSVGFVSWNTGSYKEWTREMVTTLVEHAQGRPGNLQEPSILVFCLQEVTVSGKIGKIHDYFKRVVKGTGVTGPNDFFDEVMSHGYNKLHDEASSLGLAGGHLNEIHLWVYQRKDTNVPAVRIEKQDAYFSYFPPGKGYLSAIVEVGTPTTLKFEIGCAHLDATKSQAENNEESEVPSKRVEYFQHFFFPARKAGEPNPELKMLVGDLNFRLTHVPEDVRTQNLIQYDPLSNAAEATQVAEVQCNDVMRWLPTYKIQLDACNRDQFVAQPASCYKRPLTTKGLGFLDRLCYKSTASERVSERASWEIVNLEMFRSDHLPVVIIVDVHEVRGRGVFLHSDYS